MSEDKAVVPCPYIGILAVAACARVLNCEYQRLLCSRSWVFESPHHRMDSSNSMSNPALLLVVVALVALMCLLVIVVVVGFGEQRSSGHLLGFDRLMVQDAAA